MTDLEQKARAILLSYGIDSDGDWTFSADGLAAAISAALLSERERCASLVGKLGGISLGEGLAAHEKEILGIVNTVLICVAAAIRHEDDSCGSEDLS